VGDVALEWTAGTIGMALRGDDVASDEGLRTAVLLSLFTDRRAEDDDVLPSGDQDRRGWWADQFADIEGDLVGSRLWLLDRSKRLADVIPLAEEIVREALQWAIDDRVTSRVDVQVETFADRLLFQGTLHRPQGDPVAFRFAHVWDSELDPNEGGEEFPPSTSPKDGPVQSLTAGLVVDRGGRLATSRGSQTGDIRALLNKLGWFG